MLSIPRCGPPPQGAGKVAVDDESHDDTLLMG